MCELKVWIRSNISKNVPLSSEDVDLATNIFKAYLPTLKGKSVRPHLPVVRDNDLIELPVELKMEGMEIDLDIDVVFINN